MENIHKIYKFKIKTNWFYFIFISIWTLFLFSMIIILAYNLATTPSRIKDVIVLWIFLLLILFLALDNLSWQFRGQVIIVFNNNCVELKKQGSFIGGYSRIHYFEIDDINYDNDDETQSMIKNLGLGGGKIKIEYLGRQKRIGQGLSNHDAEAIVKEMKLELIKRKQNLQ